MKKLITAFVFCVFSTLSLAGNGYCDGRTSAREVQRCYVNAVQAQNGIMNNIADKIFASNKLSQQDKINLDNHIESQINNINNTCRNDVCMYNSLVNLNRQLNQYYLNNAK